MYTESVEGEVRRFRRLVTPIVSMCAVEISFKGFANTGTQRTGGIRIAQKHKRVKEGCVN